MSLAKATMKDAIAKVWSKLIAGETDDDIMELMGIDPENYDAIRKAVIEEQATIQRNRPPEHMYVEYMVWQLRGISDLTELVEKLKITKNTNATAMVAAIKVRSGIYDQLIAKGQEFGVLKKTPEKTLNIGGLFVADLTNDKLRTQITTAVSDLDKLMKRYGDVDMTQVDPGSLHHGPRLAADSSLDGPTTVIEAPPAKDDMLTVVAKPKPEGPRAPANKGKNNKSVRKATTATSRGKQSHAIRDELRFERWG